MLNSYSGKSFDKGLYRVHSFDSSVKWSFIIAEYFQKYQNKIYPFAFDWMGRQFCMSIIDNNALFMFDPSTGEDFELQQDLVLLHNYDFVNDTDDMLASILFKKILNYCHLKCISYKECIGYKIPLFLGGKII